MRRQAVAHHQMAEAQARRELRAPPLTLPVGVHLNLGPESRPRPLPKQASREMVLHARDEAAGEGGAAAVDAAIDAQASAARQLLQMQRMLHTNALIKAEHGNGRKSKMMDGDCIAVQFFQWREL